MRLPSIKKIVLGLAILNILDSVASYIGVVLLGAGEANSITFSFLGTFWFYLLIKIAASFVLVVVAYKLTIRRIAIYVVFPIFVVYFSVTINNVLWLIVK